MITPRCTCGKPHRIILLGGSLESNSATLKEKVKSLEVMGMGGGGGGGIRLSYISAHEAFDPATYLIFQPKATIHLQNLPLFTSS